MQSFDIYFLGESLPGADPVAVRRGVAKLFKVQEASIERLFSGQPLRVNSPWTRMQRAAIALRFAMSVH
ncbi:MAG: hypothetical protein H6962_13650 [Chromatiaceae bacterium]|nr:hypothetical protein [Chromatiaceae bacterium]